MGTVKKMLESDEFELDMILVGVANSSESLYQKIKIIPQDRVYEAIQICQDAITNLKITIQKLEEKKQ